MSLKRLEKVLLADGRQGASPSGSAAAGGSCCVRVDNVDKTVQKAELFGAFAKFGTLEDCTIVRKGNPYHAIVRWGSPEHLLHVLLPAFSCTSTLCTTCHPQHRQVGRQVNISGLTLRRLRSMQRTVTASESHLLVQKN